MRRAPTLRVGGLVERLQFHEGPGRLTRPHQCDVWPADARVVEFGHDGQVAAVATGQKVRQQFLKRWRYTWLLDGRVCAT